MDRVTWQQEWTNAWAKHQQANEALDSAMPSTQSSTHVEFESIDTARLQRLKTEVDKAWSRIVELDENRPTT